MIKLSLPLKNKNILFHAYSQSRLDLYIVLVRPNLKYVRFFKNLRLFKIFILKVDLLSLITFLILTHRLMKFTYNHIFINHKFCKCKNNIWITCIVHHMDNSIFPSAEELLTLLVAILTAKLVSNCQSYEAYCRAYFHCSLPVTILTGR